eukprot:2390631-Prymnesium_polylepis.1
MPCSTPAQPGLDCDDNLDIGSVEKDRLDVAICRLIHRASLGQLGSSSPPVVLLPLRTASWVAHRHQSCCCRSGRPAG